MDVSSPQTMTLSILKHPSHVYDKHNPMKETLWSKEHHTSLTNGDLAVKTQRMLDEMAIGKAEKVEHNKLWIAESKIWELAQTLRIWMLLRGIAKEEL